MMNNTITSVYRIFLSSTAIDMVDHRKKVTEAILRMGDLPLAMETFGALPNEPVEVCKNKVRESNALVVMVAHRYGWVPEPGEGGDGFKSITRIEVETALYEGIPVFAFLVEMKYDWYQPKEQDPLIKARGEEDAVKIFRRVQALKDFREFLENKAGLTYETFTTPEDLALKVVTSLYKWGREQKLATRSFQFKRSWIFRRVHPLQPAPHFRGRKDLLKDLQQWWQDPVHPDRVRSLVAIGGTGKTAVIQRFLQGIREDQLRGSILVWSFYEEPDTDAFLREACIVFAGEEGEGVGGRLERLQRALSGNEPHLLVLDGLERVQSIGKAGWARGDLKNHRLKNLLRPIAGGLGRTRALITSRFKLTDLEQWENAGYRSTQLDVLDKQAAVEVLRAWQVQGDENQLLALVESVGRHALSVSVLGSYLAHFCQGDPKGAEEFNLEEVSTDEPQAAKLGRILAGYAKSLPNEERDLLVRLSTFPRGVTVEILGYLVDAGKEIAGELVGIQQAKLIRLAERLYQQGLVYTYKQQYLITYTAHPFLREYFCNLLGVPPEKIHEAVRRKLAIGLDTKPETKPRKPEMLDRYEDLIEHSILAGRVQEAWDLYKNAMGGVSGSQHIYHILCDYDRIIRILSLFSVDGEPRHLLPQLSLKDRSFLINDWGLAALAIGDLRTAECCFDLSNELDRKNKDYNDLAQGLQNSCWVKMNRGMLPSARTLLIESLKYTHEDNKYVRRVSHSILAYICHALGKIPDAKKNFTKATQIERKPLYAIDCIYETEHLFALGYKTKAYKRTEKNLIKSEQKELLRVIAICHTLLGLLSLSGSIIKARNHLKKAREWTDQSGNMEVILRAHFLAAEIAYCSGDSSAAIFEARAGLNQAEGCGFGLFAIDLLLQLAKINLAIPDAQAALRYAHQALDRSEHPDCGYAWGEANALHLCGICHKELKEPELARKHLKAALKVRKRIQHPGAGETETILKEL